MKIKKTYTVLYIGKPTVIGSHRMRFYSANGHKAEIIYNNDIIEVAVQTKVGGVTLPEWLEEEYKAELPSVMKTKITRTTSKDFTRYWDIIDRRVIIEKVGNVI